MRPPIAIVGASTRSAAASAMRAGFQPIAADLFADADLRAIATATRISPYPEGMLDWLRVIEPPAWMYTGALENHPELVDQMAWIAPLWGNPGEVLAAVRSVRELESVARAAGLSFPETKFSLQGVPTDGSWLIKTYRGASGSGVRVFDEAFSRATKEAEAESAGGEGLLAGVGLNSYRAYCFQRRVAGMPCAAIFVGSDGAAQLLGITRQLVAEPWLGAHGFQYAGSIGLLPMAADSLEAIQRIGNVLASEFQLAGLFGVDMVFDGNDFWILEVNPRYTASVEIVERATGIHAIAAHACACGGAEVNNPEHLIGAPPPVTGGLVHGKAILFARNDIVISKHFATMALAEAVATPWPTLADVSPAGTPIDAGRPILTVFAAGASVEEVERQLRSRAAELEQMLYMKKEAT